MNRHGHDRKSRVVRLLILRERAEYRSGCVRKAPEQTAVAELLLADQLLGHHPLSFVQKGGKSGAAAPTGDSCQILKTPEQQRFFCR
jgi:hypothetical protein